MTVSGRGLLPRMRPRDPDEQHRAASPLELFFDPVFGVGVYLVLVAIVLPGVLTVVVATAGVIVGAVATERERRGPPCRGRVSGLDHVAHGRVTALAVTP